VVVTTLLQDLGLEFVLKDLGELHYFLGVQVTRTTNDMVLSQDQYARDVLRRAGMYHCKPVKTPLATSTKLSVSSDTLLDAEDSSKYRSIVGGLQYLTLTRPDISFAVNRVCQFVHSPTYLHMAAVKRILRYIQGTLDVRLQFHRSSSLAPKAFSDTDWAGCLEHRCSTSGFAVYLGRNLVS
jgi:hypothetical protein